MSEPTQTNSQVLLETAKAVKKDFLKADLNNDGKIDYTEFSKLKIPGRPNEATKSDLFESLSAGSKESKIDYSDLNKVITSSPLDRRHAIHQVEQEIFDLKVSAFETVKNILHKATNRPAWELELEKTFQ